MVRADNQVVSAVLHGTKDAWKGEKNRGQDELHDRVMDLPNGGWASEVLRASQTQIDLRYEDGSASSWLATYHFRNLAPSHTCKPQCVV